MLISASLLPLSASAHADMSVFVCSFHSDQTVRFNLRVDFERSTLTYQYQGNSTPYRATITSNYIEFAGGIQRTRVDRLNGDFTVWNTAGKNTGSGSCLETDGIVIR